MQEGMTNDQLNTMLETIAKLIEAQAKTPQEAAQIVRDAKTKQAPSSRPKHREPKRNKGGMACHMSPLLYYKTKKNKSPTNKAGQNNFKKILKSY